MVYVFILTAIPFGFLFATEPGLADAIAQSVGAWLDATPQDMWWLFAAG